MAIMMNIIKKIDKAVLLLFLCVNFAHAASSIKDLFGSEWSSETPLALQKVQQSIHGSEEKDTPQFYTDATQRELNAHVASPKKGERLIQDRIIDGILWSFIALYRDKDFIKTGGLLGLGGSKQPVSTALARYKGTQNGESHLYEWAESFYNSVYSFFSRVASPAELLNITGVKGTELRYVDPATRKETSQFKQAVAYVALCKRLALVLPFLSHYEQLYDIDDALKQIFSQFPDVDVKNNALYKNIIDQLTRLFISNPFKAGIAQRARKQNVGSFVDLLEKDGMVSLVKLLSNYQPLQNKADSIVIYPPPLHVPHGISKIAQKYISQEEKSNEKQIQTIYNETR